MSDIISNYPMQLLAVAAVFGGCFLVWWKKKLCGKDELNLQDGIQITFLAFTALSLALIVDQVEKSAQANLAVTRGQLYDTESTLAEREKDDEKDSSLLSSIYVTIPPAYSKEKYQDALLKLVGVSEAALAAPNACSLYTELYGYEAFKEPDSRKKNADARKVFLHVQDVFYHVHNAHDYWQNKILSDGEWETWKGYIKEIGPHPMLLAVIWNGHKNRYFSRKFGEFLQQELYPKVISIDETDPATVKRNSEFVAYFYEEMTRENWPIALPSYR